MPQRLEPPAAPMTRLLVVHRLQDVDPSAPPSRQDGAGDSYEDGQQHEHDQLPHRNLERPPEVVQRLGDQDPEQDPDRGSEEAADRARDRALVADHPPHLATRGPHRPQQGVAPWKESPPSMAGPSANCSSITAFPPCRRPRAPSEPASQSNA